MGPYTELSRELSFVLEDDIGVCGYVLAVLDSRQFYKQFAEKWTPSIINKYPTSDEGLTSAERVPHVNNILVYFFPLGCC